MPAELGVLFERRRPEPGTAADHHRAGGINHRERAHGQPVGDCCRRRADAAFEIDRGRAEAGPYAAKREGRGGDGRGGVAQLAIGRKSTPVLLAAGKQVEQDRARHDRHPGAAHLEAAALLAQPSLHPGAGLEAEGRAAGERDSVDTFHRHGGIEEIGLARARPTAPHVD